MTFRTTIAALAVAALAVLAIPAQADDTLFQDMGGQRMRCRFHLNDPAGGVYCASTSAILSNCVIINCAAYIGGGAQGNVNDRFSGPRAGQSGLLWDTLRRTRLASRLTDGGTPAASVPSTRPA